MSMAADLRDRAARFMAVDDTWQQSWATSGVARSMRQLDKGGLQPIVPVTDMEAMDAAHVVVVSMCLIAPMCAWAF